jgi:hypothetical protein
MPVRRISSVGNYPRGEEVMRRLWGPDCATEIQTLWRFLHPDIGDTSRRLL